MRPKEAESPRILTAAGARAINPTIWAPAMVMLNRELAVISRSSSTSRGSLASTVGLKKAPTEAPAKVTT